MIECMLSELVVQLISDLFQKLSDTIYKLTGIAKKIILIKTLTKKKSVELGKLPQLKTAARLY